MSLSPPEFSVPYPDQPQGRAMTTAEADRWLRRDYREDRKADRAEHLYTANSYTVALLRTVRTLWLERRRLQAECEALQNRLDENDYRD